MLLTAISKPATCISSPAYFVYCLLVPSLSCPTIPYWRDPRRLTLVKQLSVSRTTVWPSRSPYRILCILSFSFLWQHCKISSSSFSGLSLELNIEQDQYIGALTQSTGVRIDISDQGEMPFPLDKGLSLAPGYETSIGMRKVGLF